MIRAAFFRCVNHGHRGSPTGDQLVAAFGGPQLARTFQTNGTVLFTTKAPKATVRAAAKSLGELGFHQEFVVRTLPEIVAATELVDASEIPDDVYRTMISFFDAPTLPDLELPTRNRNGLLEVRRLEPGMAASFCWVRGTTGADPTAFLEPLLGVPVTSRTLGTVQRLVKAAEKAVF